MALACEAAALAVDKRITNSEGASVSAQQSHFFTAHTRVSRRVCHSRHLLSVSPIAGKGNDMQRDYWHSSMRHAGEMARAGVGRYASEVGRCLRAQDCHGAVPGAVQSRRWLPGLLRAKAVSGGALYRKSTFPAGQPEPGGFFHTT